MILSTRTIDLVAERIERAYCRRHTDATTFTWDARVWSIAARALLEEQHRSPWLPVDPELFVASQLRLGVPADPWSDLAPPHAIWRYRQRVVQIVRRLRRELKAEVARAERMIGRGKALEEIIKRKTRWLSPLGRLIIAHRANRPDLIEAVRTAARHQHESCPLYRRACLTLVPPGIYPAFELVPGIAMTPRTCVLLPTFCLN